MKDRILAWFSAGATSAVACKMALKQYGHDRVEIWYFDTGAAHPDNERFIKECEDWYQHEIKIIKSEKYDSPLDVGRKTRYLNGAQGARCTAELKKKMRYKVEDPDDYGQVFGFEFSKNEIARAKRFKEQNFEVNALFPLIEAELTKPDCLAMLEKASIEIPMMYRLGYNNNNCIGCFKGGMYYFNQIRKHFPDVFEETAKLEREIGVSCITVKKKDENGKIYRERVYLDELDPNRGREIDEISFECGITCAIEWDKLT